jgi:hypothetical protein
VVLFVLLEQEKKERKKQVVSCAGVISNLEDRHFAQHLK